ncbi:MAG: hypothetical protein WC939_01420 [Acholeplasmataceae bacterium]
MVWLIGSAMVNDNFILPSINQTFLRLIKLFGETKTYISVFNTVVILLIILIVSFVISISLALISFKSIQFKQVITPSLSLLKIVPLPALIILLLTHQSRGAVSIILTTFLVIPLMYDILYAHIVSINQDILDELKLLTSFNRSVLFSVYIPLIGVGIITAFLQTFGLGLKMKVMTEFVSNAPNTIGYELSFAGASYAMDLVFAWSVILIVIVVLVDVGIHFVLRKIQTNR